MNLLGGFGNSSLPSTIKDPFKKTQITNIVVRFMDYWGRGEWEATGRVEFKNGNTSATQDFKGKSFDDVVAQIKAFVNELP